MPDIRHTSYSSERFEMTFTEKELEMLLRQMFPNIPSDAHFYISTDRYHSVEKIVFAVSRAHGEPNPFLHPSENEAQQARLQLRNAAARRRAELNGVVFEER